MGNVSARPMGRKGIFSQWQPRYAEYGIATFPVTAEKTPATKGYLRTGIRGSSHLADKFQAADALGFACGRYNKVTLVDVDTTDEKILADALGTYGDTLIISRTASGGFHAWYRHNGERRQIRPNPDVPLDILGAGYAVAPPSQVAKGNYEFIRGGLADIGSLQPMVVAPSISPSISPPLPSTWTEMREGAGRNRALWERCMRTGGGCSLDRMMEIARDVNQQFKEPITDMTEVAAIAKSAWKLDDLGLNFFALPRVMLGHDLVDAVAAINPDAFALYALLDRYHGGNNRFALGKPMAAKMGWTLPRWKEARDYLAQVGLIRCIHPGGRGPHDPPIYGWPLKGRK